MAINAGSHAGNGGEKRGFTLLIAVIFMAVVLSIGIALGSLGYKQVLLASSALESQYAFYAADAGLECALRADEQDGSFKYSNYIPGNPNGNAFACGGQSFTVVTMCYNNTKYNGFTDSCPNEWVTNWTLPLALVNPLAPYSPSSNPETRCAVVTVYKPAGTGTTYLFSQGYDTTCANINSTTVRYASRGLFASYKQ